MKKYLVFCLVWASSFSVFAESRFQAPSINAPSDTFMLSQTTAASINSSYLKVAIKNRIQREIDEKLKTGLSAADARNEATQSILEQSGLISVDNSVVVLPGAIDFAGEVTIVNIQTDSGNNIVGIFE